MKITLDKSGTLTIFYPSLDAQGKPLLDAAGAPRGCGVSIAPSNIKHHLRDPELRTLLGDEHAAMALAGTMFELDLPDALK